jgi:hypothetical protein
MTRDEVKVGEWKQEGKHVFERISMGWWCVCECSNEERARQVVAEHNSHAALVAALKEIAKGEGRYSKDRYTHACNCIEDMKAKADEALKEAGE